MIALHKEGRASIAVAIMPLAACLALLISTWQIIWIILSIGSLVLLLFILQFFRNPDRSIEAVDDDIILSPADGKVVTIEETEDSETQVGKRIQISIFMSPLNVHANRVPVSGKIKYFKYHAGKYLVAWNPKSSTENERTTFVLESKHGDIVIRQIAGAVARRIMSYPKQGQTVTQGQELGFIKFGSRCDIFLPVDANVLVNVGDAVKGNIDQIASFK